MSEHSVKATYWSPRTFGDLPKCGIVPHASDKCSFCKRDGFESGEAVYKYSTRHHICAACIKPRKKTVLPAVKKQEAFDTRMAQIRLGAAA